MWARYVRFWEARPIREQLILLGALIVIFIGVTDLLIWNNANNARKRLASQVADSQTKLSTLLTQQTGQSQQVAAAKAEQDALRERISAADAQLNELKQSITAPAEMLQRLRDISGEGTTVQLVGLLTEPGESMNIGSSKLAKQEKADLGNSTVSVASLFRLPVSVTVDGNYSALFDYLRKLEEDAPALRWTSLELDGQTWPTVRMKLRAFTLGEQPTWQVQ